MGTLAEQPLGRVLLVLLAIGLAGYALTGGSPGRPWVTVGRGRE